MARLLTIFVAVLLLFSCKSKKIDLSGEDPVDIDDFIEFFRELPLPHSIADTQISRKLPDSLLISKKVLSQFVPDSVYAEDFDQKAAPKFYAWGKVSVEKNETYLLLKAATLSTQAAYILCFDSRRNFKASMRFVKNNPDRRKSFTSTIDKRYVITTRQSYKGASGEDYYKLNAYVYNDIGTFTHIKIESNEPVVPREVYNPIDTFPHKHKLSGDYVRDKRNFVSVRDGKKANRILFFVHFEKKDGCAGEIKGEAVLAKPDRAFYRQSGDACELELVFSGNKVTLREEKGCGNYRDIKCVFEGSFTKKKEDIKQPVKKPPVKK